MKRERFWRTRRKSIAAEQATEAPVLQDVIQEAWQQVLQDDSVTHETDAAASLADRRSDLVHTIVSTSLSGKLMPAQVITDYTERLQAAAYTALEQIVPHADMTATLETATTSAREACALISSHEGQQRFEELDVAFYALMEQFEIPVRQGLSPFDSLRMGYSDPDRISLLNHYGTEQAHRSHDLFAHTAIDNALQLEQTFDYVIGGVSKMGVDFENTVVNSIMHRYPEVMQLDSHYASLYAPQE